MNWKRSLSYLLFGLVLVLNADSELLAQTSPRPVRVLVKPRYSHTARENELKGQVKLKVVVGPSGKVESAEPLGGNPLLELLAVNSVKQWVFAKAATGSTEFVVVKF